MNPLLHPTLQHHRHTQQEAMATTTHHLLLLLLLAAALALLLMPRALAHATTPTTTALPQAAAAFLAPTGTLRRFLSTQTPASTASTATRRPGPRGRRPLQATEEDDDLTERSLSLLGKLARGLNRELPVPTLLVPPRGEEKGSGGTTTIKGWFPLSMGLSLTLGNPVYPAALVGFLYLSRPTDAPDVAAAAAAALVAGVVNPLLADFADATDLDDSALGRLPFLLGAAATAYVLVQVLGEGKEVFVDAPRRQERERMPAAKTERDLKFFDVKMKQGGGGASGGAGGDKAPAEGSGASGGSGGGGSSGGASRWRE